MRLASHIVRFSLRGIPVVGNTASGALVGLTPEGAALCDAMMEREVTQNEVPARCEELVAYLADHGFTDELEPDARVRLASAYLHVTNACNLSCVGCYSADCNRNRAGDPSFGQLSRAIDVLAELGVSKLVISGGEPFLRSDLPDIACHARAAGMNCVTILTNGTRCDDGVLSRLQGNVDVISVSFDGVSRQSPAHVRSEQLFDVLVDTVGRIQAADIHAHILPTLHARNIDDVPAYLDLADALGCTVGFSLLSGSSTDLGDLMPREACLAELASIMFKAASEGGSASLNDAFNPAGALSVCAVCGAARSSVSVASDGVVYPCHMLHKPELALGNAFEDDASAIAERISLCELPLVDEIKGCSQCENRYLCGGGCRARALDECGSMAERDPYCTYYRHAIDRTVEAFIRGGQRGEG
ncbi:MAG: radical SAM protein [Coriobacteriaceae bacterium]|nr:radical SAM protein [Coriobacteriaceae bacterium]